MRGGVGVKSSIPSEYIWLIEGWVQLGTANRILINDDENISIFFNSPALQAILILNKKLIEY